MAKKFDSGFCIRGYLFVFFSSVSMAKTAFPITDIRPLCHKLKLAIEVSIFDTSQKNM